MLTRRQFSGAVMVATISAACPFSPLNAAQPITPDEDGFYVLTAKKTTMALMGDEGGRAEIWGYNGQVPGPILRVKQGEKLKLRLVNELDQDTTIHWHGIRLENAMDGTPLTQDPVKPGASFDYEFTAPDAGTYWYHPHIHASQQVGHGLYGALIVSEREELGDIEDITLVLDDWLLLKDGQIDEKSYNNLMLAAHAGRIGNWFTVNGKSRPTMTAAAAKPVRLRLINTANALVMNVVVKGPETQIIALDGQPIVPRGLPNKPIVLPPGGRVDLGLGTSTERTRLAIMLGDEELEVAYVERSGSANETAPTIILPANALPKRFDMENPQLVEMVMTGGAMGGMKGAELDGEQKTMRELVIAGYAWAFNGVAGMPKEPLFKAKKGQTVVIAMDNQTAWPHAMHLHGHHMQVVRRDEAAVIELDWRDVVMIGPKQKLSIAFPADNPGKWMIHCHMLEHQEAGMMSWFEVMS